MSHAILLALFYILCGISGVWLSLFILYTSLVLPYQIILRVFYNRSLLESLKEHLRDPWD